MEIEKVNAVKSLGAMIDETLSWSAQVEKIAKNVNSGPSIIRRLRDIVDYNALITTVFMNLYFIITTVKHAI